MAGPSTVVDLARVGLSSPRPRAPPMQTVDFFSLERSLQDRFVEAASGSVPPTPLVFTPARPRPVVLLWWAGCVLAIGATIAVLARGFGVLESSLALLGIGFAVLLAVLVALS